MFDEKVAQYGKKRQAAAPLPAGICPYTSSDLFRVQGPDGKPKAKSWDHRFSANSRLQVDSPLKSAPRARLGDPSRLLSLGTARPAAEFFPWTTLSTTAATHQSRPVTSVCSKEDTDYSLAVALNYGFNAGSPQVLRFLTEHVELIHDPPYGDWATAMTCGTTSALEMVLRLFANPGDTVLVEQHTYTGAVAAAQSQGLRLLSIDVDGGGLDPDDLDAKLSAWDCAQGGGPKPFLLYTIPTGQNPTGTTQSTERRASIYAVAQKHDLYIIEDDPYYFLSLGAYTPPGHRRTVDPATTPATVDEYVARLPRSYLSLDVDGRVCRLDSTSKILAPGLRAGWLTAAAPVVARFQEYTEVGVSAVSGPSQVLLYALLEQEWGHRGWMEWLASLSARYRARRDLLLDALDRSLPRDLCAWQVPTSGMFVWIDIKRETDKTDDVAALEEALYAEARRAGVLASRGSWFAPDPKQMSGVGFRVTFAAVDIEDLVPAVEKLGEAFRRVLGQV